MNVLVEILGKQFKVEKGDKIKVPFINQKIGEKLKLVKRGEVENRQEHGGEKGGSAWMEEIKRSQMTKVICDPFG